MDGFIAYCSSLISIILIFLIRSFLATSFKKYLQVCYQVSFLHSTAYINQRVITIDVSAKLWQLYFSHSQPI